MFDSLADRQILSKKFTQVLTSPCKFLDFSLEFAKVFLDH